MKKLICVALIAILCVSLLAVNAFAAGASATLTGPTTVRAGDTITLTFNLNGSGLLGAQGVLSYDSNQVELTSTSVKIKSPWKVDFNGNTFLAYEDGNQDQPINSNTALFTATFKVKNLETGANLTISVKDVRASAGSTEKLDEVIYSTTIAAPKSSDNTLKSLTVSNATISPAFDPNVTNYTASVPFSTSKLNVTPTANDSKAKTSVGSTNLVAGGKTKVVVTVTAENGAIKTYTITVTREADPNYTPSSNNNLSGIRVGSFLLSPAFDPNVTSYVIWLPYETESVSVTGLTEDSKASARTEGGDALIAGADNEIKVICTAENGEEKVYTVIAKRAAAHGAEPTQPNTQPTTQATTAPSTTEHVCPTVSDNHVCETGNDIPVAMVVIPWVLAFASVITLLIVLLLPKKKK